MNRYYKNINMIGNIIFQIFQYFSKDRQNVFAEYFEDNIDYNFGNIIHIILIL